MALGAAFFAAAFFAELFGAACFFAAVFPADGPVDARRYSILILIDEPQTYPKTGGFVAAPAVGRIADRIAGFLGVQRRGDAYRTALGEKIPALEDVGGDGR